MGRYTDFLEDKSYSIFESDDYLEELKKAAELFRTFDQALDTFLVEHGYRGEVSDAEEKVRFLTERLKKSGVPVPRNLRKWYSEHKRIGRKTAFQICFAFHLTVEEVCDFLRRICFMRGFDCHRTEEVIYFFAFKNGLSYQETAELTAQVESVDFTRAGGEDIIYTGLIVEEIDQIETAGELVCYLNENADKFGYNNVTACKLIQTMWESLSGTDGIAIREKRELYEPFDNDAKEGTEQDGERKDGRRKARKRAEDSIWEIYLQILGLSGNYAADFYKDRSLKPILKDNELLHPLAEDSFPDRDGLNKILNGEHVSYERVRKLLILLAFYRFWAGRALERKSYEAEYGDTDRCLAALNAHLADAGYPALYPGNPYDFLLLVSANSEYPLIIFREYMREMFFAKVC